MHLKFAVDVLDRFPTDNLKNEPQTLVSHLSNTDSI